MYVCVFFFKEMKPIYFVTAFGANFGLQCYGMYYDIFRELNILNNGMKAEYILTYTNKIKAFQRKLQISKIKDVEGNLEMFPLVNNT